MSAILMKMLFIPEQEISQDREPEQTHQNYIETPITRCSSFS
jgi:hypothetical protein